MSAPAAGGRWERAQRAVALFARDFGGMALALRGEPGPARDELLEALRVALPRAAPFLRAPVSVGEERLDGGLDLAATLRRGRPVHEKGLLARAAGGVLVVASAERLAPGVAARFAQALDAPPGPSRLGLVLLDESVDDERVAAALVERTAYVVDLAGLRPPASHPASGRGGRVAARRVEDDPGAVTALTAAAVDLGIDSPRAPLFALRAARAHAAMRGAKRVAEEDVAAAAALTLAPRAVRFPAEHPEEAPDASEPPEPAPGADVSEADSKRGELADRVVAAAKAAIPPELLSALAGVGRARTPTRSAGGGETTLSARRGRPIAPRPGDPRAGRVDLYATLVAAAPWQRLRRRAVDAARPIVVSAADVRIARYRETRGATAIFVVDASGSAALRRLGEVKGAVELLLSDCYVRRDAVALVAFRGRGAEILLPPTRSTARAKRRLSDLPGGGGTPLASGLEAALTLALQVKRAGRTPQLVLLTDGRANVARDGEPGRARAHADALAVARLIAARRIASIAIDAASPGERARGAPARDIAEAMQARYLPLPVADARAIDRAVRASRP